MTRNFTTLIKGLLFTVIILNTHFSAFSQNTISKSRVAVVTNDTKTNIWVSDFPKKTNIVIMDSENNLLSIISTNDYGAAFLSLPLNTKKDIIVKTVNGEIIVSNKAAIKNGEEPNVVLHGQEDTDKV